MTNRIPSQAWTRQLDNVLANPGKPSLKLPLPLLIKMLPVLARMTNNIRFFKESGIESMNAFNAKAPGAVHGVPLGGIGGGSINRGWRGDFRRWTLRPGVVHHSVVHADAFSLRVQRAGEAATSLVLAAERPADGSLAQWNWGMDPACATYHSLFPRAWTVYEDPLPGIRATCKQVSPVIPENYKESSYPVCVFEWTVENTADTAAQVSLMFTWQNGTGTVNDAAGGHYNKIMRETLKGKESLIGVELHHYHRQVKTVPLGTKLPDPAEIIEDPLTFAIAVKEGKGMTASTECNFDPAGDGSDVWKPFTETGKLAGRKTTIPTMPGEKIGAAVAATATIPAHGTQIFTFVLAWDMPRVHSGVGRAYLRRYTVFYGSRGNAASELAKDALEQYPRWEEKIEAWQRPVLDDKRLPDWYKGALFNELYYIVEGGTLWAYPAGQKANAKEMGRFTYLEGHEYRMLNTYDVHFYASIALAKLWPKIELTITRDFADATLLELPQRMPMVFEKEDAPRTLRGAVPHDLGWPEEDPWHQVNGYNYHDSNKWKDLNPKFILQVYRDYLYTGDLTTLKHCWQAVKEAFDFVRKFDRDGDGLIENDNFPDQTYDAWTVSGPSAYTGGLWLAAVQAAAHMAKLMAEPGLAKEFATLFERGRNVYEETLWNGKYLNYDCSPSPQHDSIMADQLAGQEYIFQCGMTPLLDAEKSRTALRTIFEKNVLGIHGGTMGAMNGVRPDGRIDQTSVQSREVWGGTTYFLAATMIHEGMIDEAFRTAQGVYQMTYESAGYWFATPEAWTEDGNYRSLTYMRPLAIWAMQDAWERTQKRKTR